MKPARLPAESYLGKQIPGTLLILRKVLGRGRDYKLRVRVDCLNCTKRGLHRRWVDIERPKHTITCGCLKRKNNRGYIVTNAADVGHSSKVQMWDQRKTFNASLVKIFVLDLGYVAPRAREALVRECILEIHATVCAAVGTEFNVFQSASDYEIECCRLARKNRKDGTGFDYRGEWTRKVYRADRAPQPLKWARQILSGAPFLWDCTCALATHLTQACDQLFQIEESTKSGRAARLKRHRKENISKWVEKSTAARFAPDDPGLEP